MESNNRKRSRKSKLVLRQVVELDEELQKILDISQDIQKPEENYLNNEYIFKIENEEPPEYEEDSPPELPDDGDERNTPVKYETYCTPMKLPKLMTLNQTVETNDKAVINDHTYSLLEATTNMQFSVNVEVEEFDDDNIDTDCLNIDENCDYGYRTNEISVRKDLFIDPDNEHKKLDLPKHVVNNIIVGTPLIESRIEALPEHIVNSIILGDDFKEEVVKPDSVYKELCMIIDEPLEFSNVLLDTMNRYSNPADVFLKLFAINNFGIHYEYINSFHPVDELIESALNTWMVWYRITKNLPMYYKCYVCMKAWWFLNDLRQHILDENHDINVDMEVNDAICNIVAYDKSMSKPPELKRIPTQGRCVSCFRFDDDHSKSQCDGCNYKFATCSLYIKHISQCTKYLEKNDKKIYKLCDFCLINFYSQKEYNEHLGIMHTVRSDVPVLRSTTLKCRNCDKFVPYVKPHDCSGRHAAKKRTTCSQCLFRFINPYVLRNHYKDTYDNPCPLCKIHFPKHCELLEHVLSHTDNYMTAVKCVICTDFTLFLNHNCFKRHMNKVHTDQMKILKWKIIYSQHLLLPKELFQKYQFSVTYEMDKEKNIINKSIENANITQDAKKILSNKCNELLNTETDFITETEPVKQKAKKPSRKQQKNKEKTHKSNKKQNKTIKNNKSEVKIVLKKENPKVPYEELLSTFFSNSDETEETVGEEDGLDLVMVKTEIKEEPFDYDLFSGSIGMNFFGENTSNQSAAQEPEIIMGDVVLKRTFCCKTCGFISYHKQFKEHVDSKICKTNTQPQQRNYRCTKCCDDFHSLKPYILHLPNHGFKLRACPECLEEFSTNCKLKYHLQTHIKELYLRLVFLTDDQMKQKFCYQCRICKLRITENEFFEHWESHLEFKLKNDDKDVKEYDGDSMCEGDGNGVGIEPEQMKIVLEHLQNSRISGRSSDLSCAICLKNFYRKTDYKRHYIEHLLMEAYSKKPRNGGLKCQICGDKYQRADTYKQHMRNHALLPIYRCEICNKSFSDSSNFSKHKKVHNLKVLICDHCGKKFHLKITLVAHLETHARKEVFDCTSCSQTFFTLGKRNKHIRQVHQNIRPKFTCLICRETFKSLKDKWNHEWEAHKERRIIADCPKCSQQFRKSTDLRRHVYDVHNMKACIVKQNDGTEQLQIDVD